MAGAESETNLSARAPSRASVRASQPAASQREAPAPAPQVIQSHLLGRGRLPGVARGGRAARRSGAEQQRQHARSQVAERASAAACQLAAGRARRSLARSACCWLAAFWLAVCLPAGRLAGWLAGRQHSHAKHSTTQCNTTQHRPISAHCFASASLASTGARRRPELGPPRNRPGATSCALSSAPHWRLVSISAQRRFCGRRRRASRLMIAHDSRPSTRPAPFGRSGVRPAGWLAGFLVARAVDADCRQLIWRRRRRRR